MNERTTAGLDRRAFLRGTAGAAAALGAVAALPGPALAKTLPRPAWSLGFISAQPDRDSVWTRAIPAARVSGDNRLRAADAAQVTISELYGDECLPELSAVDIDVPFARGSERRVLAWSFRRGPVVQSGRANQLRVPVDSAGGLGLLVNVREASQSGADVTDERLAFRGRHGLRPGHYILGFRSARTGRLPRWSAVVAAADGSPAGGWLRNGASADAPAVDFPYLVITVEATA